MLSRRHGATLCYTPMINARSFLRSETYRNDVFTTCAGDRPLVAQLAGDDPATVLAAAKLVEAHVDAVDLNLGCPQNIAKRGHYGAFLQDEWELVASIVAALHAGLRVPVTCKIRVFEDDLPRTLAYARMLEGAGCQLLTVHGRTIKQKGPLTGVANWAWVRAVKESVAIPVLCNGNILYHEDLAACLAATGCDGVMVAGAAGRVLLTRRTIFVDQPPS